MPRLLNRVLLGIFMLIGQTAFGQMLSDDLELLKASIQPKAQKEVQHRHQPEFLLHDHTSPWVRYNPATLVFGGLMYIYQSTITHHLSSTCIYSPTCSSYSKNLISDYGLISGIIFTADRLTRCNRLALYDYPPGEIDRKIHRIRQDTDYYQLRQK